MHEIRRFLSLAAHHLGHPFRTELTFETEGFVTTTHRRRSWSAFITYGCLELGARYSNGELPLAEALGDECVADFSWDHGGPVIYADVAHVLIPRFFDEEHFIRTKEPAGEMKGNLTVWRHEQDIDGLSALLMRKNIEHGCTRYALELKRF